MAVNVMCDQNFVFLQKFSGMFFEVCILIRRSGVGRFLWNKACSNLLAEGNGSL